MFKIGQWVEIKEINCRGEVERIYPVGKEDVYKLKGFTKTFKESELKGE